MASPMTVRAFARWLGVSHTAVQRRISAGSLPASAKRVRGQWRILDAEQAKAEWEAHTRPRIDARKQPQAGKPSNLADATLRERIARAEAFELETARKKGLLISAAEVSQRWTAVGSGLRTGLLGLPTRARQQLPHLRAKDVLVLEHLVRELLEEFAESGGRMARQRESAS